MEDLKTRLSNLIENNKIEDAIKILKEESAKRGGSLDHIIISLSSRYKRYREKSLMGLEARDQEFTKIVSDTLELVSALDDPSQILQSEAEESTYTRPVSYPKSTNPAPASGQSDNKKYIQMGIGGLAVIGLITIIGIFMGGGDTATETDATEDQTTLSDDSSTESDFSSATDDQTFTDPGLASDQGGNLAVYDVSGHWRQVAQSFGPESDCPNCTIDITQEEGSISVLSNNTWYANLAFNSQNGTFDGLLNWGNLSPSDPAQNTSLYMDENSYLIIVTYIQGVQYTLTYAK